MKYSLIMLPNPIIVSDEKITEESYVYGGERGVFIALFTEEHPEHFTNCKKIVAAEGLPRITEVPEIDVSLLTPNDLNIIKWVDVDAYSTLFADQIKRFAPIDDAAWLNAKEHYAFGFRKSQYLNQNKFSIEDIEKAVRYGRDYRDSLLFEEDLAVNFKLFVQSISKPKVFGVELEMEEKGGDNLTNAFNEKQIYYQQPKITNNKVKIINVWKEQN
jgi:hypothetical protein